MSLERIKMETAMSNQSLVAVIARFRCEILNNYGHSFKEIMIILSLLYGAVERWKYENTCSKIYKKSKKKN